MDIKGLLKSKKYSMFKKAYIRKNIDRLLDSESIDFFLYDSSIDSIYISDKSFMSFLDDKISKYIIDNRYVPKKLVNAILEDKEINDGFYPLYRLYTNTNHEVNQLLNNNYFPKSISTIITNNLDNIINYSLLTLFIEYKDDEAIIKEKLTSNPLFYSRLVKAIDEYATKLCGDTYNEERKTTYTCKEYKCDNNRFNLCNLIDYIVLYYPKEELAKEECLKILCKYKIEFEKLLMNKLDSDSIRYLLEGYIYNGVNIDKIFTNYGIKVPDEVIDFIFEHYIDIICLNTNDIFILRSNVQEIYGDKYSKIINNILKDNKDIVLNSMVNPLIDKKDGENYRKFRNILKLIVEDLMINEEVTSYLDIEKIGHGRSNKVYKIGNKVIKLGKAKMRLTLKFPNNPYIIQPLLRRVFDIGGTEIIVEVAEYVPQYVPNDKEKEEMYLKLRKLGIIWIELNNANFSKLEKDNIIYWRSQLLVSDESLLLEPKVGSNIVLHKGDIVINDADGFYTGKQLKLSDIKTNTSISPNLYDYESKYKKYKL